MKEKKFCDAEAGDKIYVSGRCGFVPQVQEVLRTTKTLVFASSNVFTKSGRLRGGGSYPAIFARLATEEDLLEMRRIRAKQRLASLHITDENLAITEQFIAEAFALKGSKP